MSNDSADPMVAFLDGLKNDPRSIAKDCFRYLLMRFGRDVAMAAFDGAMKSAPVKEGRGQQDPFGDAELLQRYHAMPKPNLTALVRELYPDNGLMQKSERKRLQRLLSAERAKASNEAAEQEELGGGTLNIGTDK